jgi:hypothetical protein
VLRPHPTTTSNVDAHTNIACQLAMENAFAKPIQAVFDQFRVDPKDGLTDEQVIELRTKHGRNGMSVVFIR